MSKKCKLLLALSLLLIPTIVQASDEEYYVNSQNVIFDEANYHNLKNVLGEQYIEYMTQNEYNSLKDQEFTLVAHDEVIIDELNVSGVRSEMISPRAVSGNPDCYTTSSKILSLLVYEINNGQHYAKAINEWLSMPSVRNFDVFAMKIDTGFSVVDGSQQGTQYYSAPSEGNAITYQYNGTNTMRFSNGFGMSMNLVDRTDIDVLTNTITARLTGGTGDVQVSYQHCTNWHVTRAQSMDYFLNVNGLGGAIMFNDADMDYNYDRMMGVYARIR
ncbi:MAG: hypothetical protein ACI31M_01460 [Bacilli bacterium]